MIFVKMLARILIENLARIAEISIKIAQINYCIQYKIAQITYAGRQIPRNRT
jgi:hypothetical protein